MNSKHVPQPYAEGPRLLADIGGTNARFALETGEHQFTAVEVLPCAAFPTLHAALTAYLASPAVQEVCSAPLNHAALAIANPVEGDVIQMTNHHWTFSIEALRQALDLETLLVVNDFTALAMALPYLGPHQRSKTGGGAGLDYRPIGLIGAGTGLGVSGIIPSGERWIPLASEGGHVTFSPADEVELDILRYLWRDNPHVSAERLLSGPGMELMYRALAERAGTPDVAPLSAADISQRAARQDCEICRQTVDRFCAMLGTVAGNLALTLGAAGGLYIGGGIVPRLGPLFLNSPFRARFEAKGRFSTYLAQIPSYLITEPYPAFLGISAILADRLSDDELLLS